MRIGQAIDFALFLDASVGHSAAAENPGNVPGHNPARRCLFVFLGRSVPSARSSVERSELSLLRRADSKSGIQECVLSVVGEMGMLRQLSEAALRQLGWRMLHYGPMGISSLRLGGLATLACVALLSIAQESLQPPLGRLSLPSKDWGVFLDLPGFVLRT